MQSTDCNQNPDAKCQVRQQVSSVLVWIQENVGWEWGYGIPTVAIVIAICSFFQAPFYTDVKSQVSPSPSVKWGYGIPTVAIVIAVCSFFQAPFYIDVKSQVSPSPSVKHPRASIPIVK